MRLIDADVAKEMLKRHADEFSDVLSRKEKTVLIGCGTSCLDKCPTVDAVPVVHGMWIAGVCTHCGFDFRELTDGENDLEQWVWDEGFPHCPRCGAKMDGGNEE